MKILVAFFGLILCLSFAGCANTEQGLKQDTQQNEPKVAHALRKAGHEAALATQTAAGSVQKEAGKAAEKTDKQDNKPKSQAKPG
jgi:predicted small secreted protein